MAPRRRGLPVTEWPPAARDALADAGASSLVWGALVRCAYGCWLAFLRMHHLLPTTAPTPNRVEAFVQWSQTGVSADTALMYVERLHHALQRLEPSTDWRWLRLWLDAHRRPTLMTLPRPSRRVYSAHRHMKREDWPAADRDAWESARRLPTHRYDDEAGVASHWSKAFAARIEIEYGRYLAFCRDQGLPFSATHPQITAYITSLKARGMAPWSVHSQIQGVYFAVHTVLLPDASWEWLLQIINTLRAEAAGAPCAKAKHLRIVPLHVLEDLGWTLIKEAREGRHKSVRAALRFRDGLLILLLARRGLRVSNLLELALGHSLVLDDDGGARIETPAFQMKGRRAFAVRIDVLRPVIDEYLGDWRPVLGATQPQQPLWPSLRRTPLDVTAASSHIARLTESRLGRRISPHLFRDCLTTTLAEEATNGAAWATAALGHRSGGVTNRHYLHHTQSRAAQAAVERVLDRYADDDDLSRAMRGVIGKRRRPSG